MMVLLSNLGQGGQVMESCKIQPCGIWYMNTPSCVPVSFEQFFAVLL